jgi:prevent-host-death family protein
MNKKLDKNPTATEARRNFFDLLDKVSLDPSFRPIITRHGKPIAALINVDEWENLMETLSIAANPQLVRNLESAQDDIRKGKILTYDEVFGHPQPGFRVADKARVVYKLKKAVEKTGEKR